MQVFANGEAYVDHMNEKHRSIVGVNWFQCIHCLKLNKRYYNRYYPTKRSLQQHLANAHGQGNPVQRVIVSSDGMSIDSMLTTVVKNELTALASNSQTTSEILVPLTMDNDVQAGNNLIATTDDHGQQIIQQFQIQLPSSSHEASSLAPTPDSQTQQIQVIQTDPNNPDQPQYITLYTWGAT